MNEVCHLANPRITSGRGLAPARSITARLLDAAFEVRLQDLQWSASGHSTLQLGSRCSFAFVLPAAFTDPSVEYTVVGEQGLRKTVGRLNFVAPQSALELHWSSGRVRSVVCMFDPMLLGLGSQIKSLCDVDPLAAMDIRNDRLEATMGWLCEELLQPSFASELQITSMLSLLALETQRHFGAYRPDRELGQGKLSERQLVVVKDCIEQSASAGLPLQELAAACGLPSRELPVMFKNTVGVTLRSFVATCHIAKAKLLLSDSRLLVKQVAGRSGFESASAFTAAFRKATGMRPQQYRESNGIRAAQPSDSDGE